MYQVILSEIARSFYERAGSALRRRLDRCFAQIAANPRRHPNIKRLHGDLSGYWRYRVGDYRVVYRIDDTGQRVIILMIADRKDVYEQ